MAEKYLIVVDMQKDFVSGSLGTKEASGIAASVVRKVENFQGKILFTKDTHEKNYPDTQEGRLLPVEHCIRETEGWELIEELEDIRRKRSCPVYEKPSFGSLKLAEDLREIHQKDGVESVELIGLCTDICVVSNALLIKAYLPEVPVRVDSSCCAGVTPLKHDAALEVMRSCQVAVI